MGEEEGRGVGHQEDAWTAVSIGVVIAVAALDAAWHGGLEGVLVAGPLMASTQLSPRRTALVGGLAFALGFSIAEANGHLGNLHVIARLVALAALSVFCVMAARSLHRRRQRYDRLAVVAEAAQHAILRPVPARVGDVGFSVRYLSAAQDAMIGGDLYDVIATGSTVRLVVGDVRGKGLDAVRLAALVLGLFREAAASANDLDAVAKAVDSGVTGYLDVEDFVTAVFVDFAPGGQVTVVNCGHHPPLRIGAERVEPLPGGEPSPPLGLNPQFQVERHTLAPGERLLLYTDGLVEARNPDGTFFSLDRLPPRFLSARSLDDALDALVERLLAHVGGRLNDDLALVLAQPLTPGGTSRAV